MKTEYPGIDWLLDCEPRPVQLEALARSYTGVSYRQHKDDKPKFRSIRSNKAPAPGFAFLMEMRTGKTNVLFNEFMLMKRDNGLRKMLVFAPNHYKDAWQSEAIRFGVDSEVHVFNSTQRKAAEKFIKQRGEILITNYEALVSDKNIQLLDLFVDDKTLIAADESIMIKNRTTNFFKRSYAFAQKAAITRILTGKPVVQGPHDLFSQLRFARQLNGWNFYAFRNKFCKMGGYMGKQVIGEENVAELQGILSKCSFIARRAHWGTSFDPDYEIRSIKMLPIQEKHYNEMKEEFITWLQTDFSVSADQVITKHIKLQQISSGFIIDEDKKVHDLCAIDTIPKIVDLKNLLENEILGKVIIVYFYKHSLSILANCLAHYKPAIICGTDTMVALGLSVEEEKKRFNESPSCRILLGQIKAIKYGHMLMGSSNNPCETTIYYENTYSLDDRAQSEQRNQGEGQQTGVHIVDYWSSGVERSILHALQKKENIAKAILNYYK